MRKIIYLLILPIFLSACLQKNVSKTNIPAEESKTADKVQFGDPFILLHNNTYYAYGTNSPDGIEVYTSNDLKYWKKNNRLALHKNDSYGDKWFWAPEVYFVNNKFYMYYSADEHICVATSDSPLGPFIQAKKEPMLDFKAIDNSLFIDDNGKGYLFFVVFNDGLSTWVAELETDLVTLKKETMHLCIETSQNWELVHPKVNEGPYVLKYDGTYYMTYSANSYESQFYGIGVAIADNIFGKWTKHEKNPIFQKPGNLVGVGHSAMFRDKVGNLRIVFHAHHDDTMIHPREMYISSVTFKNGIIIIDKNYSTPIALK